MLGTVSAGWYGHMFHSRDLEGTPLLNNVESANERTEHKGRDPGPVGPLDLLTRLSPIGSIRALTLEERSYTNVLHVQLNALIKSSRGIELPAP